jgi:two-component system cell cycle sensor histidine kinase/response regulator CckA
MPGEFVEQLLARAPVLTFVKDLRGRYLYVNEAWLAFCNTTTEATLGRTDYELFPREIADGFVRNDRQVIETGQVVTADEDAPGPDGLRTGHSTKVPLFDAQGRLAAVGGIVFDVTQRVRAQRDLERSERRYRELLEHSPEAYVVLDIGQGRFVEANENALRFFRLTREQVLRVGPEQLSPAIQADGRPTAVAARTYVEEALRGGAPVFDFLHQAGDGELLPCRIWLARVDLASGVGVRASILDMREAERVRSMLERTRALVDAVQDALPQMIAIFDLERREVLHCNRTYADQLLGGQASVPWDEGRELCEQACSEQRARQELRLRVSDGRLRTIDLEISVFQRDAAGQPTQLLLVASDVSEQRALEEELRRTRRLESLGRLAGGVAHDFNNLLTVILGSADFLEPIVSGNAGALADLEALRNAGLQAQRLTGQLLAFAKAEGGQASLLGIDGLLEASAPLLARVLGEDMQLGLELSAADAHVRMDKGQLEQVLMNLTVNARDAMRSGGSLIIGTRKLDATPPAQRLPGLPPGHYVELIVRDTGEGIASDVLDKVFEPFFSTKSPGKGTGLGLSTVHAAVQRAGGQVSIKSSLGHGTSVHVRLPLASAQRAEVGTLAHERHSARSARILIVEDDPAVRAVAARALTASGYDVTSAEDPLSALAQIATGLRPDAVVSDMVMPGMSGLEFVERLHAQHASVPVLLVSGYAEDVLRARGLELGDLNLMPKPIQPRQLVERVSALLDSRG